MSRYTATNPPAGRAARHAAPARHPWRHARLFRRIALILVTLLLVVAIAVLGVVGWIGSERAIHKPQNTYSWSLADYPDLHPEAVTIQSRLPAS